MRCAELTNVLLDLNQSCRNSDKLTRVSSQPTNGSKPTSSINQEKKGSLLRVLGVGFGLAVTIGGTIGMGILRTPGDVAQAATH